MLNVWKQQTTCTYSSYSCVKLETLRTRRLMSAWIFRQNYVPSAQDAASGIFEGIHPTLPSCQSTVNPGSMTAIPAALFFLHATMKPRPILFNACVTPSSRFSVPKIQRSPREQSVHGVYFPLLFPRRCCLEFSNSPDTTCLSNLWSPTI